MHLSGWRHRDQHDHIGGFLSRILQYQLSHVSIAQIRCGPYRYQNLKVKMLQNIEKKRGNKCVIKCCTSYDCDGDGEVTFHK